MSGVVVLGAGGLLGRHLVEQLPDARGLDRAGCDITNLDEVKRRSAGARAIVNCAAWTNVDGAEAHEDEAYRANALGAENVARAARALDVPLVHISTDFVFDGEKPAPYDELDRPNPQSIYARSKFAGEELATRVGGKLFLVRVQGLYGAGGRNFSSKLRDLILARKPLKLDCERKVQPTWAGAAARQIVKLLSTDLHGVYHVSCSGAATWAEFARHVAERLGVERSWEEVPTSALKAPAARPPNCLFRHRMLELRGLDVMPPWQVALDEYLEEQR
jgi:dTDP-4-dehydrorhamnose reductase